MLDSRTVVESKPVVVVGIPAYNEEKTVARVVLNALKHADKVVVCDDGSSDMTTEIAERLGAEVIKHEENLGYGAAIKSLFRRARELDADILVTMDADGQHDPAEIPRLVKLIEEGVAEVVLGSRFLDAKGTADMPLYRQFGIKVITKLANGSGKNGVSDAQSGFRAYGKNALELLSTISENGMSSSVELLRAVNKSGLKICESPVSCKYAGTGVATSTKNPISHGIGLIMSIIKLIVEGRPLLYLGIPGIVSTAIGALFGVWMLDMYASSHTVTTNVALASIAFILIGFFMISTSITLYAISTLSKRTK